MGLHNVTNVQQTTIQQGKAQMNELSVLVLMDLSKVNELFDNSTLLEKSKIRKLLVYASSLQ